MDFQLDDEQQMLQDSCRRLLEDSCPFERRAPLVAAGSFDTERWQTYADMGWLSMSVPEERGGLGRGMLESCLLMEEVGRTLCVEPLWAVGVLSAQLLTALPTGPQVDDLLQGLMAGAQRPVLAHSEAEARGNVAHVSTEARPDGTDRWRLYGEKVQVVGGNIATGYMVSARTAGQPGEAHGISLFWVQPQAAGLQRRDVRLIDNRWAAHLSFDGVAVTQADLLAPLHAAHAPLAQAVACATVALCAESLGLMDRALWITRDYLKTREQFGAPLASFQSLQHRMSEMLIELELSRSMVYRALSRLNSTPAERDAAVSAAKLHIGRSGRFVCGQAIQLHGGIGVTEEYIIGHYFKRMTCISNALGSEAFHLEQLAERERLGLVA